MLACRLERLVMNLSGQNPFFRPKSAASWRVYNMGYHEENQDGYIQQVRAKPSKMTSVISSKTTGAPVASFASSCTFASVSPLLSSV